MRATAVLGCQWGDEGKGKIVDLLSEKVDIVARFSGGPNAGHTVILGSETFILHLIPSGILRPKTRCVIGNGVVVDLDHLTEEIDSLEKRGIATRGRLLLSGAAHLLLPYHRWLEELQQQDVRVGTTRRGIGPVYQDKMGRNGIRLHEVLDASRLKERLEIELERVERIHRGYGRKMPMSKAAAAHEWAARYGAIGKRLKGTILDTTTYLQEAIARGQRILCEGSQGAFLDIDHGTYPYVTSSSTTVGGIITGLGIAPRQIGKVVGIAKAYSTRVGNGPFPTEFPSRFAERFRKAAGEFGATTGRPRRCGWLDLVMLRHALRINGVTELVLTKLDVLSGISPLWVASSYRLGRRELLVPPVDIEDWERCRPVYRELAGWKDDLSALRTESRLPSAVRRYVSEISKATGVPVRIVSVGSGRDAVVKLSGRKARTR